MTRWLRPRDEEYKARDKKRVAYLEETGDLPGPVMTAPRRSRLQRYRPRPQEERPRSPRNIHTCKPRIRNPGYLRSMTIYNARGVKIGRAKVGSPVPGQSAKKIEA